MYCLNMKIILLLIIILLIINNVFSSVKCIDDGLCMTCNKDEMVSIYFDLITIIYYYYYYYYYIILYRIVIIVKIQDVK